jgi:hypothetical protein
VEEKGNRRGEDRKGDDVRERGRGERENQTDKETNKKEKCEEKGRVKDTDRYEQKLSESPTTRMAKSEDGGGRRERGKRTRRRTLETGFKNLRKENE